MKKTTKPVTKSDAKTASAPKPAAAKPATKKAAANSNGSAEAKPAAPKRAKSAATEILANIDVGFGNTLYVRGEGPGLSWERGMPLACVKDDVWAYTIDAAAKPIVFKFLINDESWCAGDDYVVEPGQKITLVPTF